MPSIKNILGGIKLNIYEFLKEYEKDKYHFLSSKLIKTNSGVVFTEDCKELNQLKGYILNKLKERADLQDLESAFWQVFMQTIENFDFNKLIYDDPKAVKNILYTRIGYGVKEIEVFAQEGKNKDGQQVISLLPEQEEIEDMVLNNVDKTQFHHWVFGDTNNEIALFLQENQIEDILTQTQLELYNVLKKYGKKDFVYASKKLNEPRTRLTSRWGKIEMKIYSHFVAWKQVQLNKVSDLTYNIKHLIDTINNFAIYYDIQDDIEHYTIIIQFLKEYCNINNEYFQIDFKELQSNKKETNISVPLILEDSLNIKDFRLVINTVHGKHDPTDDEKRKIVRKVNASFTQYIFKDNQLRVKYIQKDKNKK